jgi:hypothetical protein
LTGRDSEKKEERRKKKEERREKREERIDSWPAPRSCKIENA